MSPRIGLLWHLHQPDYRDPATGRPMMPWARLHALRGYRDLLVEAVEEQVPMTINVVPSLWDQLLHYAEGGSDRHLDLTRRAADTLDAEEAAEAVATLPGGHPAMSETWPAYAALRRRLANGPPYLVDDLRDLQVWATLSWFGSTAFRDEPELAEIAAVGRNYAESDKVALLAVQDRTLRSMPQWLLDLAHADGPSLCTSPYYHPILPLLVDARHALRNLPDLPDDVRFAWPEDALEQLASARQRLEALTGKAPMGLWPSEGSVSPEVVTLASTAGFRWLLSDQGVLQRSHHVHTPGRPRLGGWSLGEEMVGFFRDTDLSDRIGFRYAQRDPVEAADDFVHAVASRGAGLVVVALDGENPWETYADAGGAFRRALYRRIEDGRLHASTFDEAAEEPPVGRVEQLHTGSWIGANFQIWIGQPADHDAWRALAELRQAVATASPAQQREAMRHVLAAEGSDWTWWYGDDFHTEWEGAFDALYRAHLRAGWHAIGRSPPASLDRPIAGTGQPLGRAPEAFLDLDWANASGWLPWVHAGVQRAWGGSMAQGSAVLEIRYGWSSADNPTGVGDLWVRVAVRGDQWRVREPMQAESRVIGDALVIQIPRARRAALQLEGPGGVVWPPAPVVLEAPERPSLTWWDV